MKYYKKDNTKMNPSDRQYQEVTQDSIMKTAVKLCASKVKLSTRDMQNLFEDYTKKLSHQSSVRTALLVSVFFHENGGISEAELAPFREKMIDVITTARALRRPETAGSPEPVPNEQNQKIEVLSMKKERSFAELSDLFAPGQEKRFANENFTPAVLDYLYYASTKPQDYAPGMIAKFLFKGVAKIANKDKLAFALLEAGAHFWKDDGLTTNVQFEAYLLEKKNQKAKFAA